MRRLYGCCFAGLVLAGCTDQAAHQWSPPNGPVLALDLPGVSSSDVEDTRARWELASGLVVTIQALERELDHPILGRDPGTVAEALETRVELGDATGELASHQCQVLGYQARCVEGWTEAGTREFARSGAVFELGEYLVWLDVAGDRSRTDEVRRCADEVLHELAVGAES